MPIDTWLVEEKITLDPKPEIRAVYIRLLEQIIEALKEDKVILLGENRDEIDTSPIYTLPTVIFAFLNTESQDVDEGEALAQLYCYSDRSNFLKDFTSYGDEDYLKEFGLENYTQPPAP